MRYLILGLLALPLLALSAEASGVVGLRARVVVHSPVVQRFAVSPIYSAYSVPLVQSYAAPLALEADCGCASALQVRSFAVQRVYAPVQVERIAVQRFAVQRVAVQRVVIQRQVIQRVRVHH